MKYLRRYNESTNPNVSMRLEEIRQTLKEILLDLNDEGFVTTIKLHSMKSSFEIVINRIYASNEVGAVFSILPCKETILRMIDYMKSERYDSVKVEALDEDLPQYRDITAVFTNRFHRFFLNKRFKVRRLYITFHW